MFKSLKKILVTGASLLMMASVGAGISNGSNAHAAYRTEDQYPSRFNRLIPGMGHGHLVDHNFRKNGYVFNVYTVKEQIRHGRWGDLDPIVVGVNGDRKVSNHQVWRALEGHRISLPRKHHKRHYRRPVRHHYRKHARRKHARKRR